MADTATTTERINVNGRLTVDKEVRELLDIDGKEARVEVQLKVLEVLDGGGDE